MCKHSHFSHVQTSLIAQRSLQAKTGCCGSVGASMFDSYVTASVVWRMCFMAYLNKGLQLELTKLIHGWWLLSVEQMD